MADARQARSIDFGPRCLFHLSLLGLEAPGHHIQPDDDAIEILPRRGSPENPLKPEDIEYKFRHVARSCLAPGQVQRVIDLTRSLEKLDGTSELIAILAAPTAA